MAKQRFYVVWRGRDPGIFTDWPTAQASVIGFQGAAHKRFNTLTEAEDAFRNAPALPKVESAVPQDKTSKNPSPSNILDPEFDVHIFCDGGCDPNPGKAASGVVVYQSGELKEMFYGLYEPNGTNNTAELNALHYSMMIAEEYLSKKDMKIQIQSDSTYSVNAMTKWCEGWIQSGRLEGKGKALANTELIKPMFELFKRIRDSIELIHVKAHFGITGNELADRMCTLAIRGKVSEFQIYDGLSVQELLEMDAT